VRRYLIQAHSALFGAALALGLLGHHDIATTLAILAVLGGVIENRRYGDPA
jgi:hypothetical protein